VLDPFQRVQGFDSSGAVLLLAGGNRQSKGIENNILGADSILLRSQIEDAVGDGGFLLRSERHAVFVYG
jgi:hypothetical protein